MLSSYQYTTGGRGSGTVFDDYLLLLVGIGDILLALVLFVPIPYVSLPTTGSSWIPLTVIYVLLGMNMAAFLRFAVLTFGHGPWRPGRPPRGGYVILLLLAAAFGIIVAYTMLYSGFA